MSRVGRRRPPAGREEASRWSAPLRSRRVAALLTAVLAMAVFANSLFNGFAYDDVPLLVQNQSLHSLSELPRTLVQPYWSNLDGPTARELGLWRPVTTAFLTLQWSIWGEQPMGYHAVNVVLHGAATALVVLLLAELISVAAALFGGALFAVHPVHVEAVANVVGGAEVLATVFVLAASILWLRERGPPGAGRLAVLSGLYALAVLTKESAIVLPALLLLLDAWRERLAPGDLPDYLRRRGAALAAFTATGAAILWLRLQVLGSVADPQPPLGAELLQEIPRIWTVPSIWTHYARLLFFPVELSPDYAPAVIDVHVGWNPLNVAGVVLALATLGLGWMAWRSPPAEQWGPERPHPITLAVLWFVLAVLPVSNVLFLAGVLLAERTLYLPSVALAIVGGWGVAAVLRRSPRPAVAGTALVIALMAGRTWTANPVWRSTDAVFDHLLRIHPESVKLQWALARKLHDEDRPRDAMTAYRLAVGVGGSSYSLVTEVVRRLISAGKHAQAETLARRLWREHPDRPQAPALLAAALVEQGDDAEALRPGRRAVELDPDDATTHHLLAVALERLDRREEAIAHRRAAIASGEAGRWQQWRWLADLHAATGDTGSALASLDSARARAEAPGAAELLDSLREAWAPDDAPEPAVSIDREPPPEGP